MATRYGFIKEGRGEEFREEDVWDVMNEEGETGFRYIGGEFEEEKPLFSVSRLLPSAARMIPGAEKHEELQDDGEGDEEPKMMNQHSAPVKIPDWSKIYGKSPRRKNGTTTSTSASSTHDDDDDAHHDEHDGCFDYDDDNEDDDDDDEGGMAIPPHEWLARKLARRKITSFSVCEGAGRTLKGRDLSRVRNAVLSKTGFI